MQAPRPSVHFRFRDEIHRAAGHVGCFGILLWNAGGLVGVDEKPAVLQRAIGGRAGIGPVLPGVGRVVSVFAQVCIVARAGPAGRMQAVVALKGLEAAFGDMHADDRVRRNPQHSHAFEIRRHVGLADQHIAHADLLQMIAQRRFTDAQRPAIPVRAVRTHVAAGIEGHARGAADRRLHIGVREAHAPLRHCIDVRRLQGRMAGAAQIIVAKLIAHDPEDVFGPRHILHFDGFPSLLHEQRSCVPSPDVSSAGLRAATTPHWLSIRRPRCPRPRRPRHYPRYRR